MRLGIKCQGLLAIMFVTKELENDMLAVKLEVNTIWECDCLTQALGSLFVCWDLLEALRVEMVPKMLLTFLFAVLYWLVCK